MILHNRKIHNRKKMRSRRSGFTLLEVLLALGLSVVLITGIGMAIRIHLVTLTKQQKEIESKQIARSVIMMISNDIRAAMQYRAQDFSALENLQMSEAMILGLSGAMSGGDSAGTGDLAGAAGDLADGDPQGGSGAGDDPTGEGSGEEEAPSFGDPAAEDCVSCRPTLFGTANYISVDVSRLPRVDEYNPIVAANSAIVQLPSDVKMVAYFVEETRPVQNESAFGQSTTSGNGGLYRRQMDRAVAAYIEDNGGIQVDQFAQLVAEEVAHVSLRYYDGESWVDEWDSEVAGGFPPAVEIVVVIDPERVNANAGGYQYGGFDADTMQTYRSVIHLPTSELGGG